MFKLKNILLVFGVVLSLLGVGIKSAEASCTMQYCSGLGTGSIDGYVTSIGLGNSGFHVGDNMNVVTQSTTDIMLPIPWAVQINITTDDGQSTTNNGNGFQTFSVPTTVGSHMLEFNGTYQIPYLTSNGTYQMGSPSYETGSITYTVLPGGGNSAVPPTIANPVVLFVTSNAVGLQATVTGVGMTNGTTSATITERGFCYFKQSQSPSTEICVVAGGTSTGSFTMTPVATTLTPSTPYHWYGYAKNSAGLEADVWGTFTTTAAAPTVSLTKQQANLKNLVKAGSSLPSGIGTASLQIHIAGLPAGKKCGLRNTESVTPDADIGGVRYENNYPVIVPVDQLLNTNNFKLVCDDSLGTTSTPTVPVKGQSGILNAPTSCTIASGASSCSNVTLSWSTTNPYSTTNLSYYTQVKRNGSAISSPMNDGSTTVSIPYTAGGAVFTEINTVDGENNTASTPTMAQNNLNTKTINTICVFGTDWNGSICAPTATKELTASAPNPSSATANVAKTFTSTISNTGNATTGISFNNFFQVASSVDGTGIITDKTSKVMTALGAGLTDTTTVSHTFTTDGTYSIRACADKSNRSTPPPADIIESDENNNCSAWTNVSVVSGSAPDLVASNTSPTNAVINVATTFSSTIKNQGTAPTDYLGVNSFTNLFQTSTLANGGGTVTSSIVPGMATLNSGSSAVTSNDYTFTSATTIYMRVCADNNASMVGTIIEGAANEGNNCSAWTAVTVSASAPDLVASKPPQIPVFIGKPIKFTSKISNNGNAPTGDSFYNSFKVSTLLNGEGTVTILTSIPSPMTTIPAGSNSRIATSASYTFNGQAGTYYVQACADSTNAINESNEANNCSAWNAFPVNIVLAPDLVASVPSPTNGIVIGNVTTFSTEIKNSGNISTGGSFINIFQISPYYDGVSGVKDFQMGGMAILASGATKVGSAEITIPAEGMFIRACADKSSAGDEFGVINESNENNNCSAWIKINNGEGMVDGYWTWGPWNACSVPCGDGTQTRNGVCTPPMNGGNNPCNDPNPQVGLCNLGACIGGSINIEFSATPSKIFKGRSSTLKWTSNADSCVGSGLGFNTGGLPSGNDIVNPKVTTSYEVTCTKATSTPSSDFKTASVKVIVPVIIEN